MATLERIRDVVTSKPKPEAYVQDRIKRGRDRMREDSEVRRQCWEFWRGNQYCSVNSEKYLVSQSTVTNQDGTGKPSHRVRRVRNLIQPMVARKVSLSTSRVPGYEVNPSTVDLEDQGAARLAGKVARFGWDAWRVRHATVKVVTSALVADEGFAWPFFDTSIGPFIDGDVGVGDVRVRTFGPNEVFWEPGIDFHESRWHVVEQARPLDEVKNLPGFLGGSLEPDGQADETTKRSDQNTKLVMVTDYLERPSAKEPQGRWVTIANKTVICEEKPFPCVDGEGNTVDEPVLHKLAFITDPDSDRDMGLVRHQLDPQRTVNDCTNKQTEWKNLAMNPQVIVKNGKLVQKLNDIPGSVTEFWGSGDVAWRPVPPMPPELTVMKQEAKEDMQYIAADQDPPTGVESGKGLAASFENDQAVWSSFYAELADWHSRLMRHCLYLVQQFYTEPRLLKIRGRTGPELVRDFKGADLKGQADVTVLPGSIEPRTRAILEQRIMTFAQMQWISKEAAMAALNGGSAEALIDSYELDIYRAHSILEKIKEGPQAFLAAPPGPDGKPVWMPRPFDNIDVHKTIFEDFMKTQEWDLLPPPVQEATRLYYDGLLALEAEKLAREAQQQQMMAEGLGMANAARPQGPSDMPSTPGTPDPNINQQIAKS